MKYLLILLSIIFSVTITSTVLNYSSAQEEGLVVDPATEQVDSAAQAPVQAEAQTEEQAVVKTDAQAQADTQAQTGVQDNWTGNDPAFYGQ